MKLIGISVGVISINVINKRKITSKKFLILFNNEDVDLGCCGISGNYGFRKDKYEISMKIGAKLFERVKQKDFDKVICDCGTCRMQIHHGTDIKPVHPIEVLDQAYK